VLRVDDEVWRGGGFLAGKRGGELHLGAGLDQGHNLNGAVVHPNPVFSQLPGKGGERLV